MDEFQRVKGWSLERNVKRLHGWLYDPCSPLSREMDLEKIAKASQQNNSAEFEDGKISRSNRVSRTAPLFSPESFNY